MAFKIGDRVRKVPGAAYEGLTGVVREMSGNGGRLYVDVDPDSPWLAGRSSNDAADRYELITDRTHVWQPGQRFRRTRPANGWSVGDTGTVSRVHERQIVDRDGTYHSKRCIEPVAATFGAAVAAATPVLRGRIETNYSHNSCSVFNSWFAGGTTAKPLTDEETAAAVTEKDFFSEGKQYIITCELAGRDLTHAAFAKMGWIEIARTKEFVTFLKVSNNAVKKIEPNTHKRPEPTGAQRRYTSLHSAVHVSRKTLYLSSSGRDRSTAACIRLDLEAFEPAPGVIYDAVLAANQITYCAKHFEEMGWTKVYGGRNGGGGNMINTFVLVG